MPNYDKPETELGENKLKGKIKIEKKSIAKRVTDFLFSNKLDNIGYWVLNSVLWPSLRDALFQSVVGAARMTIYNAGQDAGMPQQPQTPYPYSPMPRSINGGYRAYDQISGQYYYTAPQNQPYYGQQVDLGYMPFATKDDALYQIGRLKDMITRYGKVSVKQFYRDLEITPPIGNWVIETCGWYNLDAAKPVATVDGRWIIDFPPPVKIQ